MTTLCKGTENCSHLFAALLCLMKRNWIDSRRRGAVIIHHHGRNDNKIVASLADIKRFFQRGNHLLWLHWGGEGEGRKPETSLYATFFSFTTCCVGFQTVPPREEQSLWSGLPCYDKHPGFIYVQNTSNQGVQGVCGLKIQSFYIWL